MSWKQTSLYTEDDVSDIKKLYFWVGTAFGIGAVLIVEFCVYMWYLNQVAIGKWFPL